MSLICRTSPSPTAPVFPEYDPETAASNSDAYVQMFDALQRAGLSLDLDENARQLERLENPYDPLPAG